jgi:probable HAF family extracellular repeat protein
MRWVMTREVRCVEWVWGGKGVLAVLLAAFVIVTAGSHAAQASFMGLGDLPGGSVHSKALAVSSDGSVVVGFSFITSGVEVFRWTSGGGMVGLGDLPGGGVSSAGSGVSGDGLVVVGDGSISSLTDHPFRWTSGSGMVDLGDLPGGGSGGGAFDASSDGSVVVGSSSSTSGSEAFRWTSGGGMVGLGDLPGGGVFSRAEGVSADGSVVVGTSQSASGVEAFGWTSGGGMVGLGDLPGGIFNSQANAISADGTVIVGIGATAAGGEAFRWTSGGGLVSIGDLPGGSVASKALGVSGDGAVVVGEGNGSSGVEAFIWDAGNGIRSLNSVLVNDFGANLTGWTLTSAEAISADGKTVVGWGTNPLGDTEAWIAALTASPATLNVSGGQLLGASGVIVDGNSYDVQFLDGTCVALYNGCDAVSDFTFQTLPAATLAAQALLDQVFLDGADLFDTDPELTAGCTDLPLCRVHTPWGDGNLFTVIVVSAENHSAELSDQTDALGFDRAFDFTVQTNGVYAVWSATPVNPPGVPALGPIGTGALVSLLGLAGLGWRGRVRHA